MRTNERMLLYAGVGVAAFVLFAKARALSNLVFTPGAINNFGFADGVPVADFTVLVQNTSSAGLTINSFAGNITSNNTLVGNVYNFTPVDVPANSQTSVNISIQFKPLGIVNDIIRAFQNSNFGQVVTVDGYANVSGIQLPLHLNFSVGNTANGVN